MGGATKYHVVGPVVPILAGSPLVHILDLTLTLIPPQTGPGGLRGSQRSTCPAASDTPGPHIHGWCRFFSICSVVLIMF